MKTLHQLLAIRDKRTGYLLRWKELNNLSYCGIPPTFTVTTTHGSYCVWHESCYIGNSAYTKPVTCPKRRRPYHSSESRACICLYENFGTKHHAFKKHSSRVIRRAFKRDDMRELDEYERTKYHPEGPEWDEPLDPEWDDNKLLLWYNTRREQEIADRLEDDLAYVNYYEETNYEFSPY